MSLPYPTASRRRERIDAGFYFAGTLFQRVSLFLAVPILLRALSAAEYGVFGLLQSAVNLLPPLLALNIPATVTRLFYDGNTPSERRIIARQLTMVSGGLGLVAGLMLLLCADVYRAGAASVLGVSQSAVMLAIGLVLVGALGSNHLQVAWGIWRAENRAVHTAVANTLSGLLFLAAVGVLAATGRLGAVSGVGAYAFATAVVGVSANTAAIAGSPLRGGISSRTLAREALRFGLPVLPYLLALWGLGAGGRWIARAILTLEDTGRFTLATQLATMIGLVGRSAYDAWAPRAFEMIADHRVGEARAYLRARGWLTFSVVTTLAVVTAVALALILPRFAPSYTKVAALFPLIALAPLFDVGYMAYHTELMGLKITRPIATYTATSVMAFVGFGLVGARLYGLWGLGGAYVLAYACQLLLARRVVHATRRSGSPDGAVRDDAARGGSGPTPVPG